MRPLSGVRKATASQGDDVTLTRFVRTGVETRAKTKVLVPASAKGTMFPGRVMHPSVMRNVLVSGHCNIKLGRDVRKGRLRGYWIYSLSLEERRTCPSSCLHWRSCYGNNMPLAKRAIHGPELEVRLRVEIGQLLAVRGRPGILVRLHALGDFYSWDYVQLWRELLAQHPRLVVFGYTAHAPDSEIGRAIALMNRAYPERSWIRFSNGGLDEGCTVSVPDHASVPAGAFGCPEQTGATLACATCAACWSTRRNVAFAEH